LASVCYDEAMLTDMIKKVSKYSGVGAVLILWLAIPWGMHLIGLHLFGSRPISYLGVDPRTRVLFRSALILAAVLMSIFGIRVRQVFRAGNGFLCFLIIGQLSQIVTALVIDSGQMKQVHTIAAFAIAFSLPPLLWRFAVSQSSGPFRKLSRSLFFAELVSFTLGLGLFIAVSGVGAFGEILTVLFFHLWAVTVTARWPADQKPL
jgi:hypothetical protein